VFAALRNLEVWKRSCRVAVGLFGLTEHCRSRAFQDQVTRSALSIASNIAEGYERESSKDRVRFFVIAKGSCAECWTQLLVGMEAGLIDKGAAAPILCELEEISRMIRGVIASFERAGARGA
jgi:four helix bundle protein